MKGQNSNMRSNYRKGCSGCYPQPKALIEPFRSISVLGKWRPF